MVDDCTSDVGGIDFGFSNPFAAVWGHLDHDGVLWITGMRYVRQCTLPTHAEAIPRGVRYWCDPAAPELRVELRNAGHDAIPCVHIPGRGAAGETRSPKLHGIDLVSERIRTGRLRIVRPACMPLIRELGLYHYPDDKQSEDPVKEDDHACDALRYLIVGLDRGKVAPPPMEIQTPMTVRVSVPEEKQHGDVVDLIVKVSNPASLDATVQKLGAAAVHQDSPDCYVSYGVDLYAVRCFGCADYIAFAIDHQGYGKVIHRRPIADLPELDIDDERYWR
jgi:hypothetical protein